MIDEVTYRNIIKKGRSLKSMRLNTPMISNSLNLYSNIETLVLSKLA